MSWLDKLRDRGLEAMQPAEETALAIAEPAPEIKQVWFQTRAPQSGDLGEIYPTFYSVTDDGLLTMHDEAGKQIGDKYTLRVGEEPRQAAQRMGKMAWIKARGESDFNRPLGYQPLGIA